MKLELSHDSLAKTIYDKASAEDKILIKKRNFITRRYEYYQASGVLLDLEGVQYVLPYLDKLSLNSAVLAFIKKSERHTKRRQFMIRTTVLASSIVLLIFGIQASVVFFSLQENLENKQALQLELKEIQKQRSIAENRAQTLLNGAGSISQQDLQDVDVVKQMIIQYDTLGKQHMDLARQRDLAQSAALSDLAKKALEQGDPTYANQLASKAWELNPENKQALEMIATINQKNQIAFSKLPVEQQASYVKQSQQVMGRLGEDDFRAIFSEDNNVIKNHKATVLQSVVSSKKNNNINNNDGAPAKTPVLHQVIQQKKPPKDDFNNSKKPKKITPIKPIDGKKGEEDKKKIISPKNSKINGEDPKNNTITKKDKINFPKPPKDDILIKDNANIKTPIQQKKDKMNAPNYDDCSVVAKEANQWFRVQSTSNWALQMMANNNQQLFIRFVPSGRESNIPKLTQLKVLLSNGQTKVLNLINPQHKRSGAVVYQVSIGMKDTKFMKGQKIRGLSFGLDVGRLNPSSIFDRERPLLLDGATQNKLLGISKCLL
ncbi:hypothetical protein [Aureispira sp. CCB-E]|uniref:hypothetical protein n=1 Tax=Aureispira sp. CCB-E TaxID=3051121 RepID=UPI002868FE7D|nr:hypothetical protein [Aureispira sp. CCB-E]WMX13712.1 hypothetical protein QP953_22935 [Aureispira sp. CCB-E]